MKKLFTAIPFRFIFWGLLPLFIFGAVLPFFSQHPMNYAKEMVDLSLTWFIIYAIGFLMPFTFLRRLWFAVSTTLFSFSLFFKLSFYYLYKSKLTLSAFYILFETNSAEAAEYLSVYLDWFVILLFFILGYALYRQFRLLFSKNPADYSLFIYSSLGLKNIFTGLLLLGGVFISGFIIQKKLMAYNTYYSVKNAFIAYEEMQQVFQSNLAKPLSSNFTNVISEDEPQTYVVVIGESTTSKNMSLYGYYRNTNPRLEEIRDELLIFEDVIAPHAHTIPSLNKMLTLSNYEDPDALELGSALQLANAAGFETFWISNQQPIGIYENMVTLLSKACDHQLFLSEENMQYGSYDEKLLPPLNDALQHPAEKKLILVHLIGTHSVYKHRYPKAFDVFKDTPQTKFPSAAATMLINEYDNAMLYNDHVVREIIDLVKAQQQNSFVLYFSDHGDEIFHDIDFVGHSEYHGTNAMYEVPFLLWLSEDFKAFHPRADSLETFSNRKYLLDDFIHSLFDLGRIDYNLHEPERSLFHPNFKPRKRIVQKRNDFDAR